MSSRLILSLLGMVVVGVPMLLLNMTALGRMAEFERAIDGETVVPSAVADAGIAIDNAFGNFVEGKKIATLFDTENLARARHVVYTETVMIADVLAEGEAAPEEEFEHLWVLARANTRATSECDLLLETIAKTCGVSKSEVKKRDDGTFDISSTVAYVPSYYMGEIEVDGARDLYTVSLRLPNDRDAQRIPVTAIESRRKELYSAAQQACRELRRTTNNCVIAQIVPRQGRVRSDGTTDYYLSVKLNYVGERAEGVTETLLGRLNVGGLLGGAQEAAPSTTTADRPSVLRGGGGGQFQRPN